MAFDIARWKQETGRKLHTLRQQVTHRTAPKLIYAGLCGAAMLPLVEAFQQGEILSVMTALGGVAAGVGGNLLAEQIQRWKDGASQAVVVDWVANEVPDNADLRNALDAIVEKLDVVSLAQEGMSEDDRVWFTQELRSELAQLGNLERFKAHLEGSGAIAQGDNATALGAGAVQAGDVGGDIVTGTKTSTVFDMRGQKVQNQTNVAGDLHRR